MTFTIPVWTAWVLFGVVCYLAGLFTIPAYFVASDFWFRRRMRKAGLSL